MGGARLGRGTDRRRAARRCGELPRRAARGVGREAGLRRRRGRPAGRARRRLARGPGQGNLPEGPAAGSEERGPCVPLRPDPRWAGRSAPHARGPRARRDARRHARRRPACRVAIPAGGRAQRRQPGGRRGRLDAGPDARAGGLGLGRGGLDHGAHGESRGRDRRRTAARSRRGPTTCGSATPWPSCWRGGAPSTRP